MLNEMKIKAFISGGYFLALLHFSVQAQVSTFASLSVHAGEKVPDLICEVSHAKKPQMKTSEPDDPLVIPDMELVATEKADISVVDKLDNARISSLLMGSLVENYTGGRPFRVAVWGDSHMAAGFFTRELIKQLGLRLDQVQNTFIPANMNRAGVRLPVRKTCVSPKWRYESAHANIEGAQSPGPALVNLSSADKNASLSWDLRNSNGIPELQTVQVLYQQNLAPVRIAISVDNQDEVEVILKGDLGSGVLELVGNAPISVLKIRLLEGTFRLHGLLLKWLEPSAKLQLDLFAYPGATVAGWRSAKIKYFQSWFPENPYDLVILAYGTNEGNVKPFDPATYQSLLSESIQQMKSAFPKASCLLISPGDRGVLLRKSTLQKFKNKKGAKLKPNAKNKTQNMPNISKSLTNAGDASKTKSVNLFLYTSIHEKIAAIQKEVGNQFQCNTWSMLEAMGGTGSSYAWAKEKPPLMANDLIHFTPLGYERLAQKFASDFQWTPAMFPAE